MNFQLIQPIFLSQLLLKQIIIPGIVDRTHNIYNIPQLLLFAINKEKFAKTNLNKDPRDINKTFLLTSFCEYLSTKVLKTTFKNPHEKLDIVKINAVIQTPRFTQLSQ